MTIRIGLFCVLAIVAFAPVAAAQVVSEDACLLSVGCAAHADCSADPSCNANACANVPACAVGAGVGSSCAVNDTITGHTCSTTQGASMQRFAPDLSLVGLHTGADHASLGVSESEGGVSALNLPNTWTSDEVDSDVTLLGFGAPETSLGLYHSTIDAGSHTFSTISLTAVSGNGASQANLYLLDNTPDDCSASSDVVAHASVACRDVLAALP